MNCLMCSNKIDELSDDKSVRAELAKWIQLTVTAQRNGGSETLLAGHVCPAEVLSPIALRIAKVLQK